MRASCTPSCSGRTGIAPRKVRVLGRKVCLYLLTRACVERGDIPFGRVLRRTRRRGVDASCAASSARDGNMYGRVRVVSEALVVSPRKLEVSAWSRMSTERRGTGNRRRTRCRSGFWDNHSPYNFYDDDAKTAYEVLGVEPDAEDAEIKKSFRKLVLKYHPDVNKDPGSRERFTEIREAYKVLSMPSSRAAYDSLQGISEKKKRVAAAKRAKARNAAAQRARAAKSASSGYTSYASRKYATGAPKPKSPPKPKPKPEDEFYGVDDLFRDLSSDWEKERKKAEEKKEETAKRRSWFEDLLDFLEESAPGIEDGYDGSSASASASYRPPPSRSAPPRQRASSSWQQPKAQQEQRQQQRRQSPPPPPSRQPSGGGGGGSQPWRQTPKRAEADVDEMLAQLKKEMGID